MVYGSAAKDRGLASCSLFFEIRGVVRGQLVSLSPNPATWGPVLGIYDPRRQKLHAPAASSEEYRWIKDGWAPDSVCMLRRKRNASCAPAGSSATVPQSCSASPVHCTYWGRRNGTPESRGQHSHCLGRDSNNTREFKRRIPQQMLSCDCQIIVFRDSDWACVVARAVRWPDTHPVQSQAVEVVVGEVSLGQVCLWLL